MGMSLDKLELLQLLTGELGYNMARNLQAKLPSTDTLRIYDINAESVQRFAKETKGLGNGAAVTVASNARDVAEDSVSLPHKDASCV
jgi:hypothetical protein